MESSELSHKPWYEDYKMSIAKLESIYRHEVEHPPLSSRITNNGTDCTIDFEKRIKEVLGDPMLQKIEEWKMAGNSYDW
jgi:hypothetical protein